MSHRTTMQYFAGLDLGQGPDATALAVLEQTGTVNDDYNIVSPRHYAVRHLERFPPGTSYTEVFAQLGERYAAPPMKGAPLVVDLTAAGRAVLALLQRSLPRVNVLPVAISAGHQSASDGRGGRLVPRKDLVGVLQVLLMERRLKVAPELAETDTLVREMTTFRAKPTMDPADDQMAAWREGPHDDLVLSVAIAAWQGERTQPWRLEYI